LEIVSGGTVAMPAAIAASMLIFALPPMIFPQGKHNPK
jgi:hypothetical protein